MCGISGFCDFSKNSNKDTIINMTDVLHHRGPDDSGYSYYNNKYADIGLGHRRLSILDLSKHGHQPMVYKHLEIIYNGEVYNFREIRDELIQYNYTFESDSDTEVILKAYHKWGIKAVDKFNGMFAIVIYDNIKDKLIFIRDRAGVKPFYYYKQDNLILFSSELKSFHKNTQFKKEISNDALALYLQFGYIPQPHTIFKNAYKLKAGYYLEIDLKTKQIEEVQYWDIIKIYNKPKLKISESKIVELIDSTLQKAYSYRMVSDVPVGVFLSGGYDSTSVASILQKNSSTKINTFTIGVDSKRLDEAPFAKKIAKHIGTNHTEYYCTQDDVKEILPTLAYSYDEPFGDSSAIPTTLVCKVAKKHVKVVLSADGGDETFGGYVKYDKISHRINNVNKIPLLLRKVIASTVGSVNPENIPFTNKIRDFKSRYYRGIDYLTNTDPIVWSKNASSHFLSFEINKLLKQPYKSIVTSFDDGNNLSSLNDTFSKMLAIDYLTYQNDDILTKVDRATMSQSIEGREPMLDHNIVELLSQVDTSLKFKNNELKYLLKQVVHKYVPKEIMDRPKMGFGIPIFEWLKDDLKEYLLYYLDESRLKTQGIFDEKFIVLLRDNYLKGSKENINQLWIILMFQLWYEEWM
jgi:asparagine synthase (glutamine-hydrolysing)